jgi:hypothetical protein
VPTPNSVMLTKEAGGLSGYFFPTIVPTAKLGTRSSQF